ncbi:MAG: CheY-like chemotaxis protein [Myxococcota bacterium]|jgi:CheY-like chemotaxis protein
MSAVQTTPNNSVPSATEERNLRILIVDDNHMIHEDIRKILAPEAQDDELSALEADLFGAPAPTVERFEFEIDSAMQGQEGLAMVEKATAEGRPYALAFVDLRMPPGWDGVETIGHLWRVDPDIQVVICTAYSDYTWAETIERLGRRDNLLILKKPFDVTEVEQLAHALTERWELVRRTRTNLNNLSRITSEQGRNLEVANAQLQRAHDQVAEVERLLCAAHQRESAGRVLSLAMPDIDEATRNRDWAALQGALEPIQQAALYVTEQVGSADVNAAVASAVTYATRHLGLTDVSTDFGSSAVLRCPVGDLHHTIVALMDGFRAGGGSILVQTTREPASAVIRVVSNAPVPPESYTLGRLLAEQLLASAGGTVRLSQDGTRCSVELRFSI